MMIKSILLGVAAVLVLGIAGVLIYAATKPDTFRIQRAAIIKAPPEKILPLLTDLRRHGEWSPFEKKDPAMKRTYSGAASGKGQVYEWDGNSEIGAGRMEVLDVAPARVIYKLDFLKPFEAHNTAEIAMNRQGEGTAITWAMYGPNPYLARVMQTFFNVDKMVGAEFETGLANLKTIAEN